MFVCPVLVEILDGGEPGKSAVRSMVVVKVLEAVEDGFGGVDGTRQVVDLVELVAPGTVASFDGAVELGPFGWQLIETDAPFLADFLELGLELGAAVDSRVEPKGKPGLLRR